MSVGRPNTLSSLALTCRQLRSRSHLVMFRRVQLESSDHVFDFIAFLQANLPLKTLVRIIVVTPAAFNPSLLYILPNLSSIECVDESQLEEPEDEDEGEEDEMPNMIPDYMRPPTSVRVRRSLAVHRMSLACFTRLGVHIQTLHLNSVSFPTTLSLAQMLLAFANITRLVCKKVEVKTASNGASLEVVAQRLSERMQLKEFVVSIRFINAVVCYLWLTCESLPGPRDRLIPSVRLTTSMGMPHVLASSSIRVLRHPLWKA